METHLGLKIKKIREIKNIDQTFIAKQLGISQSDYSELEHGKVKISDAKLKQIADILEVSPEVITQFNETVAFNSCTQSGFITNQNNTNPLEKITNLYDRLLLEKDAQIALLKNMVEMLKG